MCALESLSDGTFHESLNPTKKTGKLFTHFYLLLLLRCSHLMIKREMLLWRARWFIIKVNGTFAAASWSEKSYVCFTWWKSFASLLIKWNLLPLFSAASAICINESFFLKVPLSVKPLRFLRVYTSKFLLFIHLLVQTFKKSANSKLI